MRAPDKHTFRDKRLLGLERELARLSRAQWNAPIVPLARPYQRGWIKSFVLRDDARHHPETRIFQAILPEVNQAVRSPNRNFVLRNGDAIVLHPRILSLGDWKRLAWSIRHQRLFAFGNWPLDEVRPWSLQRYRRHVTGFRLMRTWWLGERVEPHMITHQRVDLPEVRSRIAEIEAFLEAHLGHYRLSWLHGRRLRWSGDPRPARDQRAAAAIADQYNEAP